MMGKERRFDGDVGVGKVGVFGNVFLLWKCFGIEFVFVSIAREMRKYFREIQRYFDVGSHNVS